MLGLKSRKYKKINFLYLIMKSLNNFAESLRYEAPQVEVIEVEVEKGFAQSLRDTPDFGYGGDLSGN
jgi:hypothetical protein